VGDAAPGTLTRRRPDEVDVTGRPRLGISGTVLRSRRPPDLAAVDARLLDWPMRGDEEGWVVLRPDDVSHGLSFHEDVEYVAPVWPSGPDAQQMMVHLDIGTDDLDGAVAWANECGATLAEHQPQPDGRVMLDPDGHPFCLFPAG
jgi:hypothetical protein